MLNPPGIGLISTISYHENNNPLEANFRRGVANDQWCDAANPRDNRGYTDASLKAAIDQFNDNTPSVGLIVTVGGVTAAIAARQYAKKLFISLLGATTTDFPGTIRGNFYGGVLLDTVSHNDHRVTYLNGLGHQSAHICLLINPDNLKLAAAERQGWLAVQTAVRGKIFEARDQPRITAAFDEFFRTASLTAMVVSSDPYFQDNKDFLIDTANNDPSHKKRVCYPFQIYGNSAGHPPSHGHHTLYGPDLASAYYALGQKARTVITTGNPSTLDPVNDAQDHHDG
jgi:hypothetical protein